MIVEVQPPPQGPVEVTTPPPFIVEAMLPAVNGATGPTGPIGPTGPTGVSGQDGNGTPYYGQVSKTTSDTITVSSSGAYQSTGLTGVLDIANSYGITAGTNDGLAVMNINGQTTRYRIYASADIAIFCFY